MDGSLAPPSLDLSEFPSLTNRSMGPNENGGSSSLTGRSNYGRPIFFVQCNNLIRLLILIFFYPGTISGNY
jgi:hypothetical protein